MASTPVPAAAASPQPEGAVITVDDDDDEEEVRQTTPRRRAQPTKTNPATKRRSTVIPIPTRPAPTTTTLMTPAQQQQALALAHQPVAAAAMAASTAGAAVRSVDHAGSIFTRPQMAIKTLPFAARPAAPTASHIPATSTVSPARPMPAASPISSALLSPAASSSQADSWPRRILLPSNLDMLRRRAWVEKCVAAGYEVLVRGRVSSNERFINVLLPDRPLHSGVDLLLHEARMYPFARIVSDVVFRSTTDHPLGAFPKSLDAFRRVFVGSTFYSLAREEDKLIQCLAESLGGCIDDRLTASTTYVLALSAMTMEYRAAFQRRPQLLGILHMSWLGDCFRRGERVPADAVLPLRGVSVAFDSFNATEQREVERIVTANGGRCCPLKDRAVTHIVSNYPTMHVLRLWANQRGVVIVSRLWLDQLLDSNSPIDPNAPCPPVPKHEEERIRAKWKTQPKTEVIAAAAAAAPSTSAVVAAPSSLPTSSAATVAVPSSTPRLKASTAAGASAAAAPAKSPAVVTSPSLTAGKAAAAASSSALAAVSTTQSPSLAKSKDVQRTAAAVAVDAAAGGTAAAAASTSHLPSPPLAAAVSASTSSTAAMDISPSHDTSSSAVPADVHGASDAFLAGVRDYLHRRDAEWTDILGRCAALQTCHTALLARNVALTSENVALQAAAASHADNVRTAAAKATRETDEVRARLQEAQKQQLVLHYQLVTLKSQNMELTAAAAKEHEKRAAAARQAGAMKERLIAVKKEKADAVSDMYAAAGTVERVTGEKRKLEEESEERKEHDQRRIAEHQAQQERLAEEKEQLTQEKERLAEQLDDLKLTCCICMDAPPAYLYQPCGHIAACAACDQAMMKRECPKCQTKIKAKQKFFL